MARAKAAPKPRSTLPRLPRGRKPRGGAARERWRRRGLYLTGSVIAASVLVAWWQPPALQRALAPLWAAAGPALIALPIWGAGLYLTLRRSGVKALAQWRIWVAAFLAIAALTALPNATGGLSIGWLPLESDAGAVVAGSAGLGAWLRVGVLVLTAATLAYPGLVWRISASSARGIGSALAASAQRVRRMLNRSVRSGTRSARGIQGEVTPSLSTGSGRPRIVLPAQAQADDYDEAEDADPDLDTEEEEEEADDIGAGGDEDANAIAITDSGPRIVASRSPEEVLASADPFASLPSVRWSFPPLETFTPEPAHQIDHEAHLQTAEAIESTLGEYGIEARVTEVRPGPTVTLYGLRPGWTRRYKEIKERDASGAPVTRREEVGRVRVKVDRIAALDRDLALQLKAPSVRFEAPIPGTNLIGIEVPNAEPQTVYLRSQLQSEAFRRMRARTKLVIPLGKGSGGEAHVADLSKMPHLLIAGATGSGKSVFINSLITSLLWHTTPEDVRFIMVDPKRVELTVYNGIPHLITPVVVETNKVVNALHWLTVQMEDRLHLLAEAGVRDIASYNRKHAETERLPYLVLIVDELADLMITIGKAVEQGLVRLAQMGRATGIHLVVATQRPSVDVVTGLIKANFPTRISFMVTALVDSRTILDGAGAEKLLGRGDMLYLSQDASRPIRIQGGFVSEEEAKQVVTFWQNQTGGYVPPELPDLLSSDDIVSKGTAGGNGSRAGGSGGTGGAAASYASGGGEMMERARELAELYGGKVSTSLLQRRLGIGYPRAARLRDLLAQEGLASGEIPNAPAETRGRGRRKTREG